MIFQDTRDLKLAEHVDGLAITTDVRFNISHKFANSAAFQVIYNKAHF